MYSGASVAMTETERSWAASTWLLAPARAPSKAAMRSSLDVSASEVFKSRWIVLTFSATGVAHHCSAVWVKPRSCRADTYAKRADTVYHPAAPSPNAAEPLRR